MSKVLLVEDDFLIMETTKELLEVSGYDVIAVTTGQAAVDAVEKEENDIDVLLLDLSLPDISGFELLPKLMALKPEMNAIICSGSILDTESLDSNPLVKGTLNKPFDLIQLQNTISKVLGSNQNN